MNEITISDNGESEVKVIPLGDFTGSDPDGRPVAESMTDGKLAMLEAKLADREVLVDKDHQSEKSGLSRDTAAMGWMSKFKKKIDGLWAKIKWTNVGKELISNRVYRFLSPTLLLDENGEPTDMTSVALTNTPAFGDKAKPIVNSEPDNKNPIEEELTDMTKEEILEVVRAAVKEALTVPDPAEPETTEGGQLAEDKPEDKAAEATAEKPAEEAEPAEAEVKAEEPAEEKAENEEAACKKEASEEAEVIKIEALNSAPKSSVGISLKEEPKWKSLSGDEFRKWVNSGCPM